MRTLAIDLGERRIGLALSDEGATLATPLDVVEITSLDQAIPAILPILQREHVQRIILGLPLNMDGTPGPAARATVAWGKLLAEQSHLPVLFVDERLTSFAAEQTLVDRKRAGEKITRKQKKQQLDALAAAAFLQEFLDGKLQPIDL